MVGSLIVDGDMESGVRVWDGSEGDAMVSSLVVVVTSLWSAWINSKVPSDSKLLLKLKVLSLSSSMSSLTLACNIYYMYSVLCDLNKDACDQTSAFSCPLSSGMSITATGTRVSCLRDESIWGVCMVFIVQVKVRKDGKCLYTGSSKRKGAKLRESFCPAAASHSRPCQASA